MVSNVIIKWDGKEEGRVKVLFKDGYYVKVSNNPVPCGARVLVNFIDDKGDSNHFLVKHSWVCGKNLRAHLFFAISCDEPDSSLQDITFPERGLYFLKGYSDYNINYTASLITEKEDIKC